MARKTTSATKVTPRKKSGATRKETPSAVIKQQRPMFPVGTWITVVVLAALAGFAFYLNREKESAADATPTSAEINPLFAASEGTISSIEITPSESGAQPVRIVRNEKNIWVIELPLEAEADQGLAEAAATQVSALKIITPIDGDLDIFGLDKPAYTVTIEFAGGKKHTLEVGDSTPTNSGYYVRLDKGSMMVTSLSGIDALLQLVNSPPYLSTPTPTPSPATSTPVPPTQAATVTPTP